MNADSVRGLKGTNNNCSLIAMDNCGLTPDPTGLTRGGMSTLEMEVNLKKQAHIVEITGFHPRFGKFGRMRLKEFVRRHPEGIFITCSHNHFAAVIDGVVFNSRHNQLVKWAWRITKKEPGE